MVSPGFHLGNSGERPLRGRPLESLAALYRDFGFRARNLLRLFSETDGEPDGDPITDPVEPGAPGAHTHRMDDADHMSLLIEDGPPAVSRVHRGVGTGVPC